jgi:hypothetical protein
MQIFLRINSKSFLALLLYMNSSGSKFLAEIEEHPKALGSPSIPPDQSLSQIPKNSLQPPSDA